MPDTDPSFATPQEQTNGTEYQGTAPPAKKTATKKAPAKKATAKKATTKKAPAKKTAKKTASKRPEPDKLSAKELAREYGFGWRFFKQDPSLWKLLQDAVREGYDEREFAAHFVATDWYKKHSDIYRQNFALKYVDPATYQERLGNMEAMVRDLGGRWGAQLTEREVKRISRRAYLLGWDEAQIMDVLANQVTPDKSGGYAGELSGMEQRLREVAHRNGMRISDQQLKSWMRQIVRGEADVRQFENYVRRVAAKTFAAYGTEIASGVDALDIAGPYIQSMADILELNPNSIGLDDRTLRKAMTYVDPNTGKPATMSVADFEDMLRADERWQYTDQAHEQLRGYAIELGKMWGVLS